MVRRILLILLLTLVVSAEVGTWSFPLPVNKVATAVDHWAPTGLSWKDIYPSFSDEGCNTDNRSQLSCLVGIDSMARQVGWVLKYNSSLSFVRLPIDADMRTEKITQVRWERAIEENAGRVILFSPYLNQLKKYVIRNRRESAIVAAGLNGQLSIRFDPHSYLIPISQFEESLGDHHAHTEGVGISLKRSSGQIFISKVYANSRAEQMGIRRGDRLLAIDGRLVSSRNIESARAALIGKAGSRVKLRLARSNQDIELTFQRERFNQSAVESKVFEMGGNNYGLIVLNRFSTGSCVATRLALIDLMENAVGGIIFDLRDNGGGQLDEAGCIGELLLPKNSVVYSTEYLEGSRRDKYVTHLDPVYHGPLSVIVNSNTASAAEILAGSLQDHSRAIIVGERTFGKGSFQSGKIWEQNSKIAFFRTQGLYYLPSGRSTQNIGVMPDIEVATQGPKAAREFDLYSNSLMPTVIAENGGRSLLGSVCAITSNGTMSESNGDRQLGKASYVLNCLKGIYGSKAD